jgi:hypothetical protein
MRRPTSNIGWTYPQIPHHGGAKKVIAAQHAPHSASTSSTVAPHERQRGGSTPSTTARPKRRNADGNVAASCIARNDQADTPAVNR